MHTHRQNHHLSFSVQIFLCHSCRASGFLPKSWTRMKRYVSSVVLEHVDNKHLFRLTHLRPQLTTETVKFQLRMHSGSNDKVCTLCCVWLYCLRIFPSWCEITLSKRSGSVFEHTVISKNNKIQPLVGGLLCLFHNMINFRWQTIEMWSCTDKSW